MYILVQHSISDPSGFWGSAEQLTNKIPAGTKLHHSFPTKDGKHAVCLWESSSVNTVRDFLEPRVGRGSKNEYFEVENKESVVMPSGVRTAQHANV